MSLMDFLHSRAELEHKKSETYLRQQESAAKIRHLEAERRRIDAETRLKWRQFDQSVIEWQEKTAQERFVLNSRAAITSHAARTGADFQGFGATIRYPRAPIVTEVPPAALPPAAVPSFTALLAQGLIQEARKFGIFAMLIGQHWSASGIGGAVIRQCLASALVHRQSDAEQAKKLLGLPQHAKATLTLPKGHHVFRDTDGGYTELITPAIHENDLAVVARLAHENSPITARKQSTEPLKTSALIALRNQPETSIRNQSEDALQARARDIIRLQAQGKQKPEIMRLLWQVSPGASAAYEQANREYTDAMKLVHQLLGGD